MVAGEKKMESQETRIKGIFFDKGNKRDEMGKF
jgi:hypothetical protein